MVPRGVIGLALLKKVKITDRKFYEREERVILVVKLVQNGNQDLQKQLNIGFHL